MYRLLLVTLLALAVSGISPAQAQPTSAADEEFVAGEPLNLTPNARTYGGFRFAESMAYDPVRDLYVAVNAGIAQDLIPNDGYISLINPDGTVHTLKWIGVNRNGLTLNHPLGSDIINGRLYVADGNVIRWFDMTTGRPAGNVTVDDASRFNDIEVAPDGTIYATQTGDETSESWRVYRITPQGEASVFADGPRLNRPNGVAFDPEGNIVVVTVLSNDVLTFSPTGQLIRTEQAVDPGNDGLAIVADGTKYVCSVRHGTVSRIRPGQPAEIIASGIPSAASMVHDPKRNRLVIPMNNWNAITIVDLN
jgi:DNA-binding beta-propeller fold protein YncE